MRYGRLLGCAILAMLAFAQLPVSARDADLVMPTDRRAFIISNKISPKTLYITRWDWLTAAND